MSAAAGYPARVRELFGEPAHAGSLADCAGRLCRGEARALERGAWVSFEACVADGIVSRVRFRAWGCPYVIAAADLAAAALEGALSEECPSPGALALAEELGAPAERLGRLLVVEDAVVQLTAEIRGSG